MKLALVVVAWIVQVFSTAPLADTILLLQGPGDVWPYPWIEWAAPVVPLAAVGIVAVVLAHRSLWLGRPRTPHAALAVLIAVLTLAGFFVYDVANQEEEIRGGEPMVAVART